MRRRTGGRAVQSARTTLQIVDALVTLDGARTGEVADHLGISKSTASNHLYTLRREGYVTAEGDIHYPSLKFALVGEHAVRREQAYEVVIDVMDGLSEKTPFITSFIVEQNGFGRYLTPEVNQPGRVDRYAFVGQREHLHATAAGKAILAALPGSEVDAILQERGLPAMTDRTITDRDELFDELDRVNERGYAINHGENREGMYVIGRAVHNSDGTVLGAISSGSQINRIRLEEFEPRIVNLLGEYVNRIEEQLAR